MKILAFDTSNQPMSIAVVEDNKVLAEITVNIKRNHSIQLMPAIDAVLEQAKLTIDDIDRVAVAEGPGSYTGLRIAVTIAKTLAWTKEIELVGVSSLKLVAANSSYQKNKLIVPLFDARRRNIYTGVYGYDSKGKLVSVTDDTHISAEQWADVLVDLVPDHAIEFIGVDAPDYIELFKEKIGDRARLARPEDNLPRASVLGFLAQKEEPVDVHAFAPTYLKLAEAEENWLKEHPDFDGGDLVEKFKEWLSQKKSEVDYMMFPPVINKKELPQDHYQLRNGEVVDVRFANPDDMEGIIQIQKETYDGNPPWGRLAVSSELSKHTSFFLICHHLGLPISFIGLSLRKDTIHVTNIATIPAYQQHGIGTFLIQLAAELGRKFNRKVMTLEVRVSNDGAKRLYRKIGFEDGQIKRNYYHNNGEDALDMFFNLEKLDG